MIPCILLAVGGNLVDGKHLFYLKLLENCIGGDQPQQLA